MNTNSDQGPQDSEPRPEECGAESEPRPEGSGVGYDPRPASSSLEPRDAGIEKSIPAGPIVARPHANDLPVGRFWNVGPDFASVTISIAPPDPPLALLERLGPSPFERGGFPVIGFLATTYDKVSRYALTRGNE
jgi:hypothetical protein